MDIFSKFYDATNLIKLCSLLSEKVASNTFYPVSVKQFGRNTYVKFLISFLFFRLALNLKSSKMFKIIPGESWNDFTEEITKNKSERYAIKGEEKNSRWKVICCFRFASEIVSRLRFRFCRNADDNALWLLCLR